MIEFFREGGFNMWVLLIAFFATVGYGLARPKAARPVIFLSGTIFILISGMLGMATGMVAVAHHYDQFPDKTAAIAQGLSELSNNGSFAAALALVTGGLALAFYKRPAA